MDLTLAYAVMGLDSESDLSTAKKAYRARAILLHPDRVEGGLRSDAEAAMAQLNEAWGTVREHLECPASSRSPSTRAFSATQNLWTETATARREPVWGECDLCGFAPARPIKSYRISGTILFWRYASGTADLCRDCAGAYVTEAQAHCMTKGWWGVFAFPATLIALVLNWVAVWRHRKGLVAPESRDPVVVTPVSQPAHSRPLHLRPVPIVATLAAWALAGALLATFGSSSASSSTTSTPGVGACVTDAGRLISCSDANAVYRLTETTTTPDTCTGDAFQDRDTKQWYCSARLN